MPHITLLEKDSGKTHRVAATDALVGRDPACAIFVEGEQAKTVSGRHARFFLEDTRWCVEDAGSRNGTYVGTRKLEPGSKHTLSVGDVIGLGLTGTQLAVQEVVGRAFAATMLEAPPVPNPALAGGTVPMRRSEAARAGLRDMGQGEEVRIVLRGVQSGATLIGHGDRVTIGRALECIIRVEGDGATSVSRVHSEVSVTNGKISIRDGGSRHGTFVNGKKIDGASPLIAGDTLMLGPGGPTYTVEELTAASDTGPAAPGAPATAHPDGRSPGWASPPLPVKALPGQGSDAFFKAELPTPALGRPAVKATRASVEPSRAPVPASSAPRTARSTRNRQLLVAAGLVVAIGAAAGAFALKRSVDRSRDELREATARIAQQSAALDSARTTAVAEANAARASLDSAIRASAAPTVLDSLRRALADAERRAGPPTAR